MIKFLILRCAVAARLPATFAALAALLTLAAPAGRAAALTWDTNTVTAGAQDGGGTWANLTGNWRNVTTSTDNVSWTNANFDSATFGAGTDGTYGITLAGTVQAAGGITFNNSGYTLAGTTLSLINAAGTGNAAITVASTETATINSSITYVDNAAATITVNSTSTLNLGGGLVNKPQLLFTGAGTLNINAGTFGLSVPRFNTATNNQTAGTVNINSINTGAIGNAAGRNVNYTIAGTGTMNVNSGTAGSGINLGRNMAGLTATLTLQSGGAVNIGTTAANYGSLNLGAQTGNNNSLLDVQGGAFTIGAGQSAANSLVFFSAGADASRTATLQQSGGTATINGIQFGGSSVFTYDASALAKVQLSGGTNYIGTLGITRSTNATTLPYLIQLLGGTLGASADWSSDLDMKLGATGAGATIQAEDSGGNARNITLSGSLTNDTSLGKLTKTGAGTLTLSGANTYSGATAINAGTLRVNGSTVSATTINSGGTLEGSGTLGGVVTNDVGGTFSPGDSSIGTLTLNNQLVLKAGSTNTFEVDGTTPANDIIVLGGTATYGGVLNIVPSGSFTVGQSFTLFTGAGATDPSNFASIVGSPGGRKSFAFANGVLTVVSATLTNSVNGGVLSLSWPAGDGWRLQYQTNALNKGLSTNWLSATDSSISSTNIPIDKTKPTVFYRLIQGVDSSTLNRKLMMGYQGWFACKGEGSANNSWVHWFNSQTPAATNATFDFWPDTSELDADELFSTSMTYSNGTPAKLYSCYKQKTVVRHFKWMQDNNLDGVFLQRFLSGLNGGNLEAVRNQVVTNVRVGAETYSRVFAIMYDISNYSTNLLMSKLTNDWLYLVNTQRVTNSPAYLRHKGKPVVAIWGFGFSGRDDTPAQAQQAIAWFKAAGCTVMGGVPTGWRTLTSDSDTDPAWAAAFRAFDVISPWTVGRYSNNSGADTHRTTYTVPDLANCITNGIDYLPVIFPGFSWTNLNSGPFNQIPRNGGNFYWRQAYNAVRSGCTMVYGAMFDEVDEGTAMYKLAPTAAQLPAQGTFVPLNIDGYNLNSDWYLRLADQAGKMLRGDIPQTATIPITPP